MKIVVVAGLVAAVFTLEGAALAYKPVPATPAPPVELTAPDARSLANDQAVARRAYRAACSQHQNAAYCDCTTAGVAQVLMPDEVRIAARTIGERINAEGDALYAAESDNPPVNASTAERIDHVEGFYANACAAYRD